MGKVVMEYTTGNQNIYVTSEDLNTVIHFENDDDLLLGLILKHMLGSDADILSIKSFPEKAILTLFRCETATQFSMFMCHLIDVIKKELGIADPILRAVEDVDVEDVSLLSLPARNKIKFVYGG